MQRPNAGGKRETHRGLQLKKAIEAIKEAKSSEQKDVSFWFGALFGASGSRLCRFACHGLLNTCPASMVLRWRNKAAS